MVLKGNRVCDDVDETLAMSYPAFDKGDDGDVEVGRVFVPAAVAIAFKI